MSNETKRHTAGSLTTEQLRLIKLYSHRIQCYEQSIRFLSENGGCNKHINLWQQKIEDTETQIRYVLTGNGVKS